MELWVAHFEFQNEAEYHNAIATQDAPISLYDKNSNISLFRSTTPATA